jgi:hypothetical protein
MSVSKVFFPGKRQLFIALAYNLFPLTIQSKYSFPVSKGPT